MAEVDDRRRRKTKIWSAIVVYAFMAILYGIHWRGWFDFTSPRGTLAIVSMLVVLESLGGVLNMVTNVRSGQFRPLSRGSRLSLQSLLAWRLTHASLAYLMWDLHGWTSRDVGLSPVFWPALWFLTGFALYPPLLLVFRWIRFPGGMGRPEYQGWFRAMHAFLPRARAEWTKVWWIMFLNPFTEEFLYRGVLVYMASSYGTPVPLAVLFGAVLCAIGHLYQGPKGLWFHLTFYAFAVALLFSPGGLWAAFGFHLAGDLIPTLYVPRNFRALRAKRCLPPRAPELKAAA